MIRGVKAEVSRRLAQLSLLIACVGCSGEPTPTLVIRPEPLPFDAVHPDIPDDAELLEGIAGAVEFRQGSNFDRNFDAVDPGEGIEHATFTQIAIDAQNPTLDFLFAVGDELFEYEFRVENGLGNQLRGRPGVRAGAQDAPNMRRVHKAGFGGPDSFSCATCHSKGGPDGAGANTQNAYLRGNGKNANTADERNAPHLLGLGPISALGNEMTEILQGQRDAAVARALAEAAPQEQPLMALGVSFGMLTVNAEGAVDTSRVKGIDPDLVVRPFGWKGHHATIRGISEESFRIHMGIISMREQAALRDGELDKIDYGDGTWFDVDRDGQSTEVEDGMLTTMVAYLAQLEIPVIRPPRDEGLLSMFARGESLFDEVGCGQCHRPTLLLTKPVLKVKPAEARYADRPEIAINVATDGEHPKIDPIDALGSAYKVHLFSDLRRHDMGERLTSGYKQGHLSKSTFLTRPLWGLADTAPYLHDGRAPTVPDAIVWHGGDAQPVRDLYLGLEDDEQKSLQVFLLSLDREPILFVP
jgi:mono/diheme cytochrome c family protein